MRARNEAAATADTGLRVAIVHEWFTVLAGSEKVLEQLCALYPTADLFFVHADPAVLGATAYTRGRRVTTSFISRLPGSAAHYRSYLLLMPLAVEQFDMSPYDLILSSSHAVAKGVLTGPNQLHISYVHSPIRYAWDLQHQYLRESGLDHGLKGWVAKWMLHKVRIWDNRTAAGVDEFIANSRFIARRIRKVYGRNSTVIHPPVDIASFEMREEKEPIYLAASRLVPYKKMDLIAEAFSGMPQTRLVIIGDGPEAKKVRSRAGPNVTLLGYQTTEVLRDWMQRAKAFVFAAEEDFGIIPVEAQACGTPVIAFGSGGACETIRAGGDEPTGILFKSQTTQALQLAVASFEHDPLRFSPRACRANAERFSSERFKTEFAGFVADRLTSHRRDIGCY